MLKILSIVRTFYGGFAVLFLITVFKPKNAERKIFL